MSVKKAEKALDNSDCLEPTNNKIIEDVKIYHNVYNKMEQDKPILLYKLHWHPYIEIIKVLYGCGIYSVNSHSYTLYGGDILIINGGDMHTAITSMGEYDRHEYIAIQINPELFSDFISPAIWEKYIKPFIEKRVTYPEYIGGGNLELTWENRCICQVDKLFGEISESEDINSESIALSAVYSFASMLNTLYAAGKINEQIDSADDVTKVIKDILVYIDLHFDEKLEISMLASLAYMSVDNFYKYFKSKTHFTPVNYINFIRVEKAAKMFANEPELTAIEIMIRCGFNNQSYFIKVFKRYKNMTPLQFKRLQRRN